MPPRITRLALAAATTAVLLSACGGDAPVSPIDFLGENESNASAPAAVVTSADGTTKLYVGESTTLSSTMVRRSRTVKWSSSNSAVASVNSTGVVTARALGNATITASGSNGNRESFPTSVLSSVASVGITSRSSSMIAGDTMSVTATSRDSAGLVLAGKAVAWSVASGSAVTVNSAGLVTAVSGGTATVQATVEGVTGATSITVVAPTVASLTISPKTGTALAPGATRQFSTSATWSDLATRAVSVTYTATGGTISSSGLYTAGQLVGTFMVIANCGCGKADTAAVSIASPAQLTSLTISPKTATVNAGATQQFAATANWSTGATSLPPIAYSATGGVVTSAGLYTAPSTAGTYKVILAHSGGTLRDTATVTVQGTTVAAPPAAGFFFEDGFESGAKRNANGFTWASVANPSVSSERSFSGGYAMRFEYAAAAAGQTGWSEQRFDMGRYVSELAIEYMLYVPANFRHRAEPSPSNNKFLMVWRDQYGSQKGTWQVGMEFWRVDDFSSRARFMSSRWDMDWVTDGLVGDNIPLIGANSPIKPGQWSRIRFYVKAASSRTASDGVMRMWVNDTKLMDYNVGRFHNFDPSVLDASLRNGYLMGWANSGFAEKTVFFIDDVKFFQGNPSW